MWFWTIELGKLITAAMIGITVSAITSYVIFSRNLRRVSRRSQVAQVANLEIEAHVILQNIIYETPIDRALILKMHNGGGKLYAGVIKHISILDEDHTTSVGPIKDDIQHYPADTQYMHLAQMLVADKLVVLETESMTDGMLKRRQVHDNVKVSIIFFIAETEGGLYYGALDSTLPSSTILSDEVFSVLETKIHKLRRLYEEGKRNRILH